MTANSQKLGEARVDITASTEGLEAKLSEANRQVNQFGREADKASKRVRRSFGQVAEDLQGTLSRQAGVVTGFVGIAAAVTGVGVAALRTGQSIRAAFDGAKLDGFTRDLAGASSAVDELAESFANAGASSDSLRTRASSVREAYSKAADEILRQANAAVESRDAFDVLIDTYKFGIDGLLGDLTQFDVAAQDTLNELGKSARRAFRQASNAAQNENRDIIRSAARLRESILGDTPTETQRDISRLGDEIDRLTRIQRTASSEQREQIEETIRSLRDAQRSLLARQLEDVKQESLKDIDDRVARFEAEADSIRRSRLDPIQQDIAKTQDRIGELQDTLGETADPRLQEALQSLIAELSTEVKGLRSDQAEQATRNKQDMEEAVTQGVRKALRNELSQISNSLRVTAQGIRNVEDRL